MTDAAIIYRSHFEAIENLPEEQQLEAYKALIAYCLNDEQPESGVAGFAVAMAKPLLDRWKTKRENGMKGGRPKTEKEPSENLTETESEPNENLTETKPEANGTNAQAKVKVKEKEKDIPNGISKKKAAPKHKHGEYGHVLLTDEELARLKTDYGEQTVDEAIAWFDLYIADKGYKSQSHNLAMRRWVFDALKEDKQKRARSGTRANAFNDNFTARRYDYADLERRASG